MPRNSRERQRRALIAEDDPAWQEMFAEEAERLGFLTTVVSTESAAVEALERGSFDVVVSDLHLEQGSWI